MIGTILALMTTLAISKPVYTLENTYPRAMEIVEIEEGEDGIFWTEDDVAVCNDAVEMAWKFYNPEDLEEGDVVICTMYDNGTKDTIADDKIIDVVWSGYYFEGNEFRCAGDREVGE